MSLFNDFYGSDLVDIVWYGSVLGAHDMVTKSPRLCRKGPPTCVLASIDFSQNSTNFLCHFSHKSSRDLKALLALFKNPTQQLHLLRCEEARSSVVETAGVSTSNLYIVWELQKEVVLLLQQMH